MGLEVQEEGEQMDYKELIWQLRVRAEAAELREEKRNAWAVGYEQAATAIETLLAERDALMEYVPHDCANCKWFEIKRDNTGYPESICKAPIVDTEKECYGGRKSEWEWCGPALTDRESAGAEPTDVCGVTGLPCSRCQPGPCDSRKAESR